MKKIKNFISKIDNIDDVKSVVKAIDKHSIDLKSNEKRCFLCNDIVVGVACKIVGCGCSFLNFDYDEYMPEYSRYVIDLSRLKSYL